MNTQIECNDERLHVLLAESQETQEFRQAADHLESCSTCQTRLTELAADDENWTKAQQALPLSDEERAVAEEWTARSWSTVAGEGARSWNEALVNQLLSPPSHPEMLGRLGRYEVESLIGSGGMGIVFKGFDSELNRPVAIKILAPHLSSSGAARQRFSREARAAAAVAHEHVVAIHNVDSDHAPPFLVMQYVSGGSLQDRIDRSGAMQVAEVLRIARQTAAGLAAAHAQGLVHRDVKPSNILLEDGLDRALLTDFGLARASDDASLTHTGHITGTPHYMSPEQARGETVQVRSDLFSLGSVMYTMCTGHPPFRADTSFGVLRRITDAQPAALREINPQVPLWLCCLIETLLAKSPAHRFSSAAEVAELLGLCLLHWEQPHNEPLPPPILSLVKQKEGTRSMWQKRTKLRFQALRTCLAANVGVMVVSFAVLGALLLFSAMLLSDWWSGPTAAESDIVPDHVSPDEKSVGEYEGLLESDPAIDWDEIESGLRPLIEETSDLHSRIELLWDAEPLSPSQETRQE